MRVPWEPSSCAACRRLRSKFRSRTGISAATRFGSMGIGGKGRSRAWPPSRGVTSKSPMHAGVASSLDPHARVARRARQRRRVYQSGKGRATNRGGPGGRRAHRWPVGSAGIDRARRRVSGPGRRELVSFAGRSAVFRRRRFGPALLREAPRCSCPAVACGDRGVSDSTWAAGLLFGADGVAVTVSPDRTAGDASLATATASSATTVSASTEDSFFVPSCPANVSRGRRLPCLMSVSPAIGRMAHRVRFAPAARRSSGMAHPCPRGCISCRNSAILAYRATALRHLGVAIHELWMPRPHRISTGCLVSQSVGMAPDNAATGRLQHGRYNSAGTKVAPEQSS